MTDATSHPPLNRRAVLAAGGVAGATAIAVAVSGCATYPSGGAPGSGPPAGPNPTGAEETGPSGAPASGPTGPTGPSGTALGPTSAVPVGGGVVFADQSVVVTQPTPGTFRAFSAICTHQGCTVNSVSGGTINCPCHGSEFAIADGAVVSGPARQPLPARPVDSAGGRLSLP